MGSKAPDPPDYSAMAGASEEAARYGKQAADDRLAFDREQYAGYKPILDQVTGAQLGLMNEQMRQGKDYYDYTQQQYRPLENEMVRRAKEFNTEGYREQLAQQAAADAGMAFSQTQAGNERAMASMGVNPNSGRFAGQQRASELGLAAGKASAMTNTRQQAQAYGDAMLTNTVGVGRGLVGAAQGAYGMALNAGNSAGQNSMAAGNNLSGQMLGSYGLAQNGQQMQMQGLSNIMQTQGSMYSNYSDPWMTLAGAGLGMASTYKGWTSSKDLKTDKWPVDAEGLSRSVAKLPVDEWRYKPGVEDEDRHIGPYAEDMAKLGAATPDGRGIDPISANGLTLAATKGLSQRLDRIEKLMDRPARKPSRRTARA